jgi:hypothetical protein
VLVAVCAGLAGYQHYALAKARTLAMNMFYDIKTLEVSLAQADIRLEESAEALAKTMQALTSERMREEQERIRAEQIKIAEEKKRLARERQKLKLMTAKYEEYVEQVNLLRLSFPTAAEYEKDLIVRVVRGFGESELELPADFIAEVRKYIGYWQATGRMQLAIRNLEDNRYGPIVVDALRQEGMPLYFLYLPLQESNYDSRAVGPETRYGIAKGAWQFLASTGQDYGLTPGPLAATRDYDEQDARFDFNRSSVAGAKHLKFIYGTLSQASGLLTIASYNYGQNKVRSLVESMPDNPRERNFWKFLKGYEVPKETYDYVFYIISAAVIGEDPGHFGYKFRPPLFLAAELKPAA